MGVYEPFVSTQGAAMVRDLKRLVDIASVKTAPQPGAPYGDGVRVAQLAAMQLCAQAGMAVTDLDGHIAYAHYGDPDHFIAVIAHLDVVPAGAGWDSDPFDLNIRNGYLVGRGTGDDKGPFVAALYAVRYLIEQNIPLRYGIRLILGLDEESGMCDIAYYNAHCKKPLFTFTPDAAFPVGHGEKGIYSANLVSAPFKNRVVLELEGGVASNVVPDTAAAVVSDRYASMLRQAAAGQSGSIQLEETGGQVRVIASGIAKHAGMPEGSVNAIHVLCKFLLGSGILQGEEAAAIRFLREATASHTGEPFGLSCDDGIFAPLTIISGLVSIQQEQFILNVNCRYPTAITGAQITAQLNEFCAKNGFAVADVTDSAPYYLDPETPAVALLCSIYNEITDSDEKPYVMSGGTYARHIDNAVSYGIEPPTVEDPDWVGSAHMKNEAVSVNCLLQACEIFIETLIRLQEIEF